MLTSLASKFEKLNDNSCVSWLSIMKRQNQGGIYYTPAQSQRDQDQDCVFRDHSLVM